MTPWTDILTVGASLIDELFTSDDEKAEAKLKLATLQQQGQLKKMEVAMSAILAEAKSSDPWTSRARPSFLYLFYLLTTFLVIIFPIIGIFQPEAMELFYDNVAAGFEAIPEEMWWTFTSGYLGYTGAREYGKHSKNKNKE